MGYGIKIHNSLKKEWVMDMSSINPLTTKNYNFFTYVQASFSWLKTRNFLMKPMFPYRVCSSRIRGRNWVWSSRKSDMAPSLEKSTKKSGIFYFKFFFEPKEYWDLILTMINGDRNSWTARKNSSHRSQIAIPFAKWRMSNMSELP